LKAQWAQAGINATINQLDGPAWIKSLHDLSYQALLIVNPPFNDPDNAAYRWFYSGSALTQNGLKAGDIDQVIEQGRSVIDKTQRKQAYQKFNQLLSAKYVPWDDILAQTLYQVETPDVQGFPASPVVYIPFGAVSLK